MKNVLSHIILCLILLVTYSCKNDQPSNLKFLKNQGKTMGTTYHLTYKSRIDLQAKVDSILIDINNSVSTYIPTSTISILNNDSLGYLENGYQNYILPFDSHFKNNFDLSVEIYKSTSGYFDPSIMPLVNYWGFGYKKKQAVTVQDTLQILELRDRVGLDKWQISVVKGDRLFVSKTPYSELDFSGVAKGYAVDIIAQYFNQNGVSDYFIEIGGEVFTSGVNPKGQPWTIGLSKPEISAEFNEYQALVSFSNKGMASSGNYRNYYKIGDLTYGHEINPKTGFPEINKLLGATVIAETCAIADAYATAFMVMGLEKSTKWLTTNPNIHASLFYRKDNGSIGSLNSKDFDTFIK